MRDKLAKEGLFEPGYKKPLPAFSRRIAVVTSATGAAIRDFLEVLRRRWRGTDVWIVPVRVQGEGAAQEIAAAIQQVNRLVEPPDCIVVTRGGGSLEDLWAFNEEIVVRAIFASKIPVVSAIGHEIDVTLSDLVADVRALTPSEAAELVAPAAEEVAARLGQVQKRMVAALRGRVADLATRWTPLPVTASSAVLWIWCSNGAGGSTNWRPVRTGPSPVGSRPPVQSSTRRPPGWTRSAPWPFWGAATASPSVFPRANWSAGPANSNRAIRSARDWVREAWFRGWRRGRSDMADPSCASRVASKSHTVIAFARRIRATRHAPRKGWSWLRPRPEISWSIGWHALRNEGRGAPHRAGTSLSTAKRVVAGIPLGAQNDLNQIATPIAAFWRATRISGTRGSVANFLFPAQDGSPGRVDRGERR